ncbi:MAG: methyltransferase domain-containing protein [Verrucomicrobia bacterium]|nr:methyltransferase domain-containing protein [Verrucomicrobiota bacterium]
MLQIVRFNWPKYVAAVAVCAVSVAVCAAFPEFERVRWTMSGGAACALYWIVASLLVSHWVYDRSKIWQWSWIQETLSGKPNRWANIHAGLDESSPSLMRLFPGSEGTILDIFDPFEMTEPSIVEARCGAAGTRCLARKASLWTLPFADATLDAAFLIFAAHEIRRSESRLAFFKELHRVLKPGGQVVLVEHLRDLNNFLAFGPGCFHFHARGVWLKASAQAGLEVAKEFNITPFVKVFLFKNGGIREYGESTRSFGLI